MYLSTQTCELFKTAAQLGIAGPHEGEDMPEAVFRAGTFLSLILSVFFVISLGLDISQHKRGAKQG